jgi:hypothetical protein
MNRILNFITAVLFVVLAVSCEKETDTLVTRTESLSLGANYTNDIYYRLSDGLVSSAQRTNWDIAFIVSAREAAILTNGASGVILKAYPAPAGWTWTTPVDTTGYSKWPVLYNSDTTWTEGAFNMNATGHPNYGWGIYDMTTHNLTGALPYIIKTMNGSFKKIWIEKKLSVDQKYSFRYADLNGANEQAVNLSLAGKNKNFIYYSLDNKTELDREPDKASWDIVFTKYIDKSISYSVTGVLQNIGVTAQESTDTDPQSKNMPSSGYQTNISVIGSDWKTVNMSTYQYTIDESRVFYVKDQNDKIFRIRFKTFEGASTGNLSFDITTVK